MTALKKKLIMKLCVPRRDTRALAELLAPNNERKTAAAQHERNGFKSLKLKINTPGRYSFKPRGPLSGIRNCNFPLIFQRVHD